MAVLAAAALLSAACGARVPYYAAGTAGGGIQSDGSNTAGGIGSSGGQTSANAVSSGSHSSVAGPSSGGGQTGSGRGAATNQGGGTGSGQGTGTGAGAPAGVTVANMTPATFPFSPEQQAALCTGSSGNASSAPGVSPTAITLGNVSGITGLIPNSFAPGYQAVESAFDAVNRYGGICGRQLKLDVEDDQQNASNDGADVEDLIPKAFAFVGSLSDADNGGVNAMVQAGVPDMGPAINANRSNSSVYWSATGGSLIERNGGYYIYNTWLNGLKANHDLPSSVAILSYSISISQTAGQQFASAFQQEGVKVCFTDYNIEAGAQATSIPSDVAQMKSKGCGGVYTTMDIVGNANMLDAMQNQDWHPQLIATTYEGYSPDQISSAGQQAAQGLQVALDSVPLTEPNPGVELYQQELQTYEPGNATSEFGIEAWADAEMFIYALLKSGRNPTRASFTNTLSQISGWSTDQAFGPYTPSDRTGLTCASDVIVTGAQFVTDWPSSGLYCNAQLIRVGNA